MLVLWVLCKITSFFSIKQGGKLDFLHLIAHLQVTLNPISRHRFGHRLKFHELSPTINMEFLKPYLQINITPQNIFLEVISLNVRSVMRKNDIRDGRTQLEYNKISELSLERASTYITTPSITFVSKMIQESPHLPHILKQASIIQSSLHISQRMVASR